MKAIDLDGDGLSLPKLLFRPALQVAWTDVLGVVHRNGGPVLHYRSGDHELRQRPIVSVDRNQVEEIRRTWAAAQKSKLVASGELEGTILTTNFLPMPVLATLVFACAAVISWSALRFTQTITALMPLVKDLPGEASGWMVLAIGLYCVGGIGLIAALLSLLGNHRLQHRATQRFHRWRLDREGFHHRAQDGEWATLVPVPADSLHQLQGTIDGHNVPLALLSGGDLARGLLLGLARRRGATVAWKILARGMAVRLVFLWPPVVWGLLWLVARYLEIEVTALSFFGLAATLIAAATIGAILWYAEGAARRRFETSVDEGEALVDELGW